MGFRETNDHVVGADGEGKPDPQETRDRRLAAALADVEDALAAILSYPDLSGELAADLQTVRDLLAKHTPADLAGAKESRRPRDAKGWLESIRRRAAKRR